MKLFSSGKISHRILSICLAVCMALSLTITASADSASADLTALSLSGAAVIDFSPETTEYTAYIPCDFSEGMAGDGLTVPDVYYEKASEDAAVEVTRPSTIGADSAITVSVTNGGAEKTYTINLVPIGQNMYENGSFETGENTTFGAPATFPDSVSVSEDAAYSGRYGLERLISFHRGTYYQPSASLSSGKTYLTSMMAKVAAENETNGSVRVRVMDEAQYAINSGILTNSKDHTPKTMAVAIYKGDSQEGLWGNTPSPGASVMSWGSTLGNTWTCYSAIITPTANIDARVELFAGSHHTVAYTDDYYMGELVVAGGKITDVEGEEVESIIKPLEAGDREQVSLKASFYNQTGTKAGLGNLTIEGFALADDYEGVEITEDGVLSVMYNAPSSIKVLCYAEPNLANSNQELVKAELDITLNDISSVPVAAVDNVEMKGMSVPGFKARKFKYNMYVPYTVSENYPEMTFSEEDITVTPAEGTTYDITVAEGEGDEDKLVYIDSAAEVDGEPVETRYTIKVYLVGQNLVTDGGFESGVSHVGSANGPAAGVYTHETEITSSGSGALKVEMRVDEDGKTSGHAGFALTPKPEGKMGRTYIISSDVRLVDPEGTNYALRYWSTANASKWLVDGMPAGSDSVSVSPAWKNCQILGKLASDFALEACYIDPSWTAGSQPPIFVDNYYIGELVIANITYRGDTQFEIPDDGEISTKLVGEIFNQFGKKFGLEDEKITWDIVGTPEGVTIDGENIIVSDAATQGNVTVRATVNTKYCEGWAFAKCFDFELVSGSEFPEIPKAREVKATGYVVSGETLTGSYDYYNALGIDEGESQCRWLYADSENGVKTPFPADYDENTDEDDKTLYLKDDTYVNKYIFFEVTPYTIDGTDGQATSSNYLIKPAAPTVSSITITGNGYIGSTAKASYVFSDKNGDEEDGSTYRWLRGSSPNGGGEPITDEEGNYFTDKEYTVTTSDIGKYLFFEVTPKTAAAYESDGIPTTYTGVLAAAKPKASNVKISKVNDTTYRVDYDYSHQTDISEGTPKVQWYIDGVAAGRELYQVVGAGSATVSVALIPVASKPPYEGASVSAELQIGGGNTVINKHSTSDNSSSSYSPSVVPAPEPEPEAPPVVEVPKHWAADGIEFVKTNGIMQEPAPGDFKNSDIVTRADFIYYVMKTISGKEELYAHEFGDVSGTDYFAGALQSAVNMGIISKDANFHPGRSVSRQEVCKILVLACELAEAQMPDLTKFADSTVISEWATGYVGAAVETGLLKGVSESEFSPLGAITREQTAVILKRLFDYKNGGAL